MKTLITGGAGFIDSHLADKLASLCDEIIIYYLKRMELRVIGKGR